MQGLKRCYDEIDVNVDTEEVNYAHHRGVKL